MIYHYLRVTGAHDKVLDYADLFSVTLHDDNIQEFDTKWDEVLLSMTKISSDEILESLYKLRIRESDQLKTALELYDMEIHQKISVPKRRERRIRGKSNHGSIARQTCRYYLKGICTRTPCEYWHPPECQFCETKTGCKAGDTCLFPHYKIDEQQNKRLKKGHFPKKEEKVKAKALWLS